jgi:hypothetical protein
MSVYMNWFRCIYIYACVRTKGVKVIETSRKKIINDLTLNNRRRRMNSKRWINHLFDSTRTGNDWFVQLLDGLLRERRNERQPFTFDCITIVRKYTWNWGRCVEFCRQLSDCNTSKNDRFKALTITKRCLDRVSIHCSFVRIRQVKLS